MASEIYIHYNIILYFVQCMIQAINYMTIHLTIHKKKPIESETSMQEKKALKIVKCQAK